MKEITANSKCTGCALCVEVCPTKAISMKADKEKTGFLFPNIDEKVCINCGVCEKKCIANNVIAKERELNSCFGGYSTEPDLLNKCSSGGFWWSLVVMFKKKYPDAYVVGVRYSDDYCRTEYIVSNDLNVLKSTIGTKYSQADKTDIYIKVKEILAREEKVLFAGLPCEVYALNSFVGENINLYTVDFVCQGPTSNSVLTEYVKHLEKQFKSQVKYLNMREKCGEEWIPQWMHVVFQNGKEYLEPYYFTSIGNLFHQVQRESCRSCNFMKDRKSDITIGDFHGPDRSKSYYNSNGTSGCLVWTNKGKELVELIDNNTVLIRINEREFIDPNPRAVSSICWTTDTQYYTNLRKFSEYGLQLWDWTNKKLKEKLFLMIPYKIRYVYRKSRIKDNGKR